MYPTHTDATDLHHEALRIAHTLLRVESAAMDSNRALDRRREQLDALRKQYEMARERAVAASRELLSEHTVDRAADAYCVWTGLHRTLIEAHEQALRED